MFTHSAATETIAPSAHEAQIARESQNALAADTVQACQYFSGISS